MDITKGTQVTCAAHGRKRGTVLCDPYTTPMGPTVEVDFGGKDRNGLKIITIISTADLRVAE